MVDVKKQNYARRKARQAEEARKAKADKERHHAYYLPTDSSSDEEDENPWARLEVKKEASKKAPVGEKLQMAKSKRERKKAPKKKQNKKKGDYSVEEVRAIIIKDILGNTPKDHLTVSKISEDIKKLTTYKWKEHFNRRLGMGRLRVFLKEIDGLVFEGDSVYLEANWKVMDEKRTILKQKRAVKKERWKAEKRAKKIEELKKKGLWTEEMEKAEKDRANNASASPSSGSSSGGGICSVVPHMVLLAAIFIGVYCFVNEISAEECLVLAQDQFKVAQERLLQLLNKINVDTTTEE